MKKYYIILLYFFCKNILFSQSLTFFEQIINTGTITYKCDFSWGTHIEVFNTQNLLNVGEEGSILPPKPLTCYSLIAQISPEEVQTIFRQVFTIPRRQVLLEETIHLSCYLKRTEGKVKEIYFEIAQNTQITPQELAQLETLIKQKHFLQPDNVCQSAEYLIRTLIVEFKDL